MIPEKIKIGGATWTIDFVKDLVRKRQSYGEMHQVCQTISIDEDCIDERKQMTLLHEILEVINADFELDLPHSTLSTLESALYQVLKDNKLTFT